MDEALDYWDYDDGELYVVVGYDATQKRMRAAEISAVEFDVLAQTATRVPPTVKELAEGIHLYPALIGANVPQKGGTDLLKKAALEQHRVYTTPERTGSGGRLWLYSLNNKHGFAIEEVGRLPETKQNEGLII